jgi:hypothetical protein
VVPSGVFPDGPGSWTGPPGQLGQTFVLDGDEPSGNVGMQNHAFMFRAAAVRQQ